MRSQRNELMRDEDYRRRFRKDYDQKFGPRVWHRDFFDAEIVACPDAVGGRQVVRRRSATSAAGCTRSTHSSTWSRARHTAALAHHDLQPPPRGARAAGAVSPGVQMGFSDAGAHLRNMAFYNFGLRLLRHVRDADQRARRS